MSCFSCISHCYCYLYSESLLTMHACTRGRRARLHARSWGRQMVLRENTSQLTTQTVTVRIMLENSTSFLSRLWCDSSFPCPHDSQALQTQTACLSVRISKILPPSFYVNYSFSWISQNLHFFQHLYLSQCLHFHCWWWFFLGGYGLLLSTVSSDRHGRARPFLIFFLNYDYYYFFGWKIPKEIAFNKSKFFANAHLALGW